MAKDVMKWNGIQDHDQGCQKTANDCKYDQNRGTKSGDYDFSGSFSWIGLMEQTFGTLLIHRFVLSIAE